FGQLREGALLRKYGDCLKIPLAQPASARLYPPPAAAGSAPRLYHPSSMMGTLFCVSCMRRALAAKRMRRRPRTDLCNSRFRFFYNPAVLYLLFPPSFVLSGLLSNHMIPFHIILGLLLVQQPLLLFVLISEPVWYKGRRSCMTIGLHFLLPPAVTSSFFLFQIQAFRPGH
ncbi:MAG: hypothetical protein IJR97_00910, partial [Clostridia bacterium]|nr:hypothetical protein [Clostridia bacterium]